MSETHVTAHNAPTTAWVHAGEVAQWVVVLMGWVWLGEQGMHVGWSMASGLLPVALWWAVRMLARGSAWGLGCAPWVFGLLGLFTASGIGLLGVMASHGVSHEWLLGLAVVWGLWSAGIETRSQSSTFQLGSVAWHPVLAAVLVIAAWQLPEANATAHLGTGVLLTLCAGCLYAQHRDHATRSLVCQGPCSNAQTLLAPSAMGLMMGSLWLGNAWCVGLGWQTTSMVIIHLSLMAGLPTVVAYVMRRTPLAPLAFPHHTWSSLALLALGALALLGEGPIFGVLAMLLPSLAWALHCTRPRRQLAPSEILSPWLAKSLTLLLGPVLLVWVGLLSPTQGPWAIHSALALLGGLALLQLLHLWWRQQLLNMPLSIQQKMEMPKP
jgi:hypothetical protein